METGRPEPWESYRTTGEFEHLDRGYHRHCGPTAITNLVLTLLAQKGKPPAEPGAVFRKAAALGKRRLYYGNFDLLSHWGGTSDLLSSAYLRAALRAFGLERVQVGYRRRLTAEALAEAAAQGAILYLQTRRHDRYGNHHLLCYGVLRDPKTGEWLLRLADGWTPRCVVLPLGELPRCHFIQVVSDS